MELPEEPSPQELLRGVERDVAARDRLRREEARRRAEREAALERAWAQNVGEAREDLRAVRLGLRPRLRLRGGGEPGVAVGGVGGDAAAAELGLSFYLSGRRVLRSRVVRPPELVGFSRVTCVAPAATGARATVRMLVTKRGEATLAYLRDVSRDRVFDRCALRHARGMRFLPGVDASGEPLDVWIHVLVSPSQAGSTNWLRIVRGPVPGK
ncbi:MAG: hypothetical protein IT371_13500 [Deltaproteobacteria bacterium]|nr:hypothetical protein [Deltaproteobacteria bacterium]